MRTIASIMTAVSTFKTTSTTSSTPSTSSTLSSSKWSSLFDCKERLLLKAGEGESYEVWTNLTLFLVYIRFLSHFRNSAGPTSTGRRSASREREGSSISSRRALSTYTAREWKQTNKQTKEKEWQKKHIYSMLVISNKQTSTLHVLSGRQSVTEFRWRTANDRVKGMPDMSHTRLSHL